MTDTTEASTRRAYLVAMMDFPTEAEDETNLWFDYEHVPDRISCKGITGARRWQLTPVTPIGWSPSQRWTKYLHFYALASVDVLDSTAYSLQRAMNDGRGSDWRQAREARAKVAGVRSPSRSLRTAWIERDVPWGHRRPIEVPEPRVSLIYLRHDLGDLEEAVNDFIDHQLAPELLMLPGFLGCDRYVAAATRSTTVPASPSPFRHPRYMDIFQITTPEVAVTGVFRQYMRSLDSLPPELRAAWQPVGCGIYMERPSPWQVSVNA